MNKSTLVLLDALTNNWFKYSAVNDLIKLSGLTKPTLYTIKKELLKNKIVEEFKGKIKIDFRNDFAYKFKLLRDAEKILSFKKEIREFIYELFDHYQHEYNQNLNSFLVIGSVADLKLSKESDIDFLVLVKQKKEINLRRFLGKKINIIEMDENEFAQAYLKGDDFIISCLSSNLLIFDNSYFRRFLIKATLPKITQEIINLRKNKLHQEIKNIIAALKKPDEFLVEKFKRYLISKARLILLEHDLIPASKKLVLKEVKKFDKSLVKDEQTANIKNIQKLVMKYV